MKLEVQPSLAPSGRAARQTEPALPGAPSAGPRRPHGSPARRGHDWLRVGQQRLADGEPLGALACPRAGPWGRPRPARPRVSPQAGDHVGRPA